jgi:hypothetical protein
VSRSNPHEGAKNPAGRWFEWNGERGLFTYYDKATKTKADASLPFTFLLLDQLGAVRGWHEASKSRIYSNEVRDTRQDVFLVKAFKGGTLGEGLYKDIKNDIKTEGGRFTSVCYIAFKSGEELFIGAIEFQGAALREWMEFTKAHRGDLYKGAIKISNYTEGKKGRIVFRVPQFEMVPVSEETNNQAKGLDAELQKYLAGYLKKNTRDRVEEPPHDIGDQPMPDDDDYYAPPITDSDIPF